jgi:glutathione S-transferase
LSPSGRAERLGHTYKEIPMSLTFFFAPMSTATVTQLVLAELDVPHETVTLDLKAGATKKPEHMLLDPNGRVPVIVHDGTSIWESAAITLYLGETFGTAKKLWPESGLKRGEAMKWVVWANVTLGEVIGRWARNTKEWVPAEQRNAKAGEAAKDELTRCLSILDEALEGRAFLGGGEFTLADTHVSSFVDWLRHMSVDLTTYVRLEAWSKRCADRPAYKRVMARG